MIQPNDLFPRPWWSFEEHSHQLAAFSIAWWLSLELLEAGALVFGLR